VHVKSGGPPVAKPPPVVAGGPGMPVALRRHSLPTLPVLLRASAPLAARQPPPPSSTAVVHERLSVFFDERPGLRSQHLIREVCRDDAVYEIRGRRVRLEWQPAPRLHGGVGAAGRLIVVDGPLHQPLADYLDGKDANAEYEAVVGDSGQTAVHLIPAQCRVSFRDDGTEYSRLDAMKIAKEQASVRERAACYVQAGQAVPDEVMAKYTKTIQQKLRPMAGSMLSERGRALLRSHAQ